MEAIIGFVIAFTSAGVLAMAAWFWLTDPERCEPGENPGREAFYGRAAWACFLTSWCALGLGLLLALA